MLRMEVVIVRGRVSACGIADGKDGGLLMDFVVTLGIGFMVCAFAV